MKIHYQLETKLLRAVLLIKILLITSFLSPAQYLTERPDWGGLWFNINNVDFTGFEDVRAGRADRVQWRNIERTRGNYDFSEIKTELQKASDEDYYYYFVLWTGPHSPDWIYGDVPRVETDRNQMFPYYLDEDYKRYAKTLFDTLAGAIASWPQELLDHLVYIQPGFGSTGDRQIYKGNPLDKKYVISDEEYVDYMKEMTISFTEAFYNRPATANMRFLWNISDYDGSRPINVNRYGEEIYGKWMKENYDCQLRKQQYTIAVGFLNPNEMDQDNEQRDNFYGNSGRWGGNPEFVRGEFNENETAITPLYKLNPFLFYYWTAISSVDRGLDAWELKILREEYRDAYAFSHRYSFYKRADQSPYAFVALRDILDYSDTERFPEDIYGDAYQGNNERVSKILKEYSDYGAKNDDNSTALNETGITYLKTTKGYNDCLWNVIARNNRRFITQIDANETSAGYWRVGITQNQPYGRFARGFDVEKEKNTMYFDVDDNYFLGNQMEDENNLKVKIIYYAEEEGSWELLYHATDDTMKKALEVTNEVGQGWLSKEVMLEDALLNNGGPGGADLVLQNTGGTNVKFHLIELERDVVKVE